MGSLCSKSSNQTHNQTATELSRREVQPGGYYDDRHSIQQNEEVSNILHQEVEVPKSILSLQTMVDIIVDNNHPHFSLILCPNPDDLLARYWINKRGHLVRSWKRRYCVLDKNNLKYYTEASPDPPFGKGSKKGQLALVGAVCVDRISEDGKTINVEIYGNHGENDLFFYVDNSEDGQAFVRVLQWAIRKNTVTMLVRNIKAPKKAAKDKNAERNACLQYVEHQNKLFQTSMDKLQKLQVYYFITTEPNGQILIRPGVMKLWHQYGDSFHPSLTTEESQIGLAWHPLFPPNQLSRAGSNHTSSSIDLNGNFDLKLGLDRDSMRIINFEDILDIRYQYLNYQNSSWFVNHHNHLHHHHQYLDKTLHSNNSKRNLIDLSSHRYGLLTIYTKYDYKLQIVCCCPSDYNENILALQQVALHFQMKHRFSQANQLYKREVNDQDAEEEELQSENNAGAIQNSSIANALSMVED